MTSEWAPDLDAITVKVVALNRRAGSVVLFDATVPDGRPCLFAADPRAAADLADALEAAAGPVYATIEAWQLLG